VLGGWLIEVYSWRYVFYINLPIGILAFLGISTFCPSRARNPGEKMDWFGFGTELGDRRHAGRADRGEQPTGSAPQIVTEAIVAAAALYLFLVHTLTADEPFVRPALFRDRTSPRGLPSSRSSASPITPRWHCSPYLQNL
jgi:DHA2 family multidrug resistance protein